MRVSDLEAGYGRKQVIHGVSLDVGAGEVVAVLGHNGAGKSTLMSAIFGLTPPTKGTVVFDGADITGRNPSANIARGLGYGVQGAEVFKSLTVVENLVVAGYSLRDQKRIASSIEEMYELFPSLGARRHARAGSLSGGERQMLALGMLLVASPRLIILDEPSGGLAPIVVEAVYNAIADIPAKLNASVLLVEQDADHALRISNRVFVLANGRIKFEGLARDIPNAAALGDLLLGY
ncbi:MAG: ABC transporter ATP-binding protein [Alphaproteobacteria bacterium]